MDVSFDAFLLAVRARRSNDEFLVRFRNGEPIAVRVIEGDVITIASPANGRSRSVPPAPPERAGSPPPPLD